MARSVKNKKTNKKAFAVELKELKVEPVVEQEVETVVEQEVETVVEQEIEPVVEQEVEPVVEQDIEPVVEQEVEPVVEQEVETVVEQKSETIIIPKVTPVKETETIVMKPVKSGLGRVIDSITGIFIRPKSKCNYYFSGTLMEGEQSNTVDIAVQCFDADALCWITLVDSKVLPREEFTLTYSATSDTFSTMPLFRLVSNEEQIEEFQYSTSINVKKGTNKKTSSTDIYIDFGEIGVIDVKEKREEVIIPKPNAVLMPNLVGLTETACNRALISLGLRLDPVYKYGNNDAGYGQACKQSAAAGNYVRKGETITVVFIKK